MIRMASKDYVPVAGDDLVFQATAANTSMNNDLTAGTSFNSVSVTGNSPAYIFTGNGFNGPQSFEPIESL